MAREKKVVVIDREGRDSGKKFLITEMSAFNTNRWALACARQLAKSGVELPQDVVDLGIGGVINAVKNAVHNPSELGDSFNQSLLKGFLYLMANVEEQKIFTLLDDLLGCVQLQNEQGYPIELMIDEHIEESSTLNKLYLEVFNIHSFF